MKRISLTIFMLTLLITSISAQETVFEEGRTIYKREQAFGGVIHTTGWGINYRYGQYTSGFSRRTFEGEIVGYKHPKEINSFGSIFDNSNGYVFGKTNSIFLFRASVGNHKTFISKQSVRGIAISYITNIGLTFAYAKPVFLEVIGVDEFTGTLFSEIVRFDPDEHTQGDIIGKGPALRGLFSGEFIPGLFLKAGLHFEYSRQASRISSIEIGVTGETFLKEIPILANDLNSRFLYNLYLTVAFGSKKTE